MNSKLKDQTKLKTTCSACGKATASQTFLTGWLSKDSTCQCSIEDVQRAEAQKAALAETNVETLSFEPDELPAISDRYEVLGTIGRGGMGSVYKVRDKTLDAIFAIKVLQQSLIQDQAALKRFEQEAEAAKKLNHANLVSVYDHGTTDGGAPYIVMDCLEGQGLAELLKESRTLEPKRALKIFMDICEALAYAHKEGVIHRDIKPTNIIVTDVGTPAERAHIVDFGIAKVMPTANRETHDLTQTGEIFGSPHYMSPEQCLGFMLDNRSDIYSLGCLMYETLTGGTPFEGANPIQVVVKHINEAVPEFPKAARTDKLVEKLENVVFRCLDKEKTERYQSVDDVLKDLKSLEAGKPIAKYARINKAKPMLSKRQAIGSLVVFIGLTIYGTATAMMINSEIGGKIFGGLISLVCLSGVWVFYSTALEVFRKRVNSLTESSGWQILLLFLLGTGCLTAIQYPALIVIGYNRMPQGAFWSQVAFWAGLIHILSLTSSVTAAACFALFRKANKFNFFAMVGKYVAVTCVLLCIARFGLPVQTAKISSIMAQMSQHAQPQLSKALIEISVALDTNQEYLNRLADVNHTLNNHEEEFNNLERASSVDQNLSSWKYISIAERFKQHKQFDHALKYYEKALEQERKGGGGDTGQIARILSDRAQIYIDELNDMVRARADMEEALKLAPHTELYLRQMATINYISGRFADAVPYLEKAISYRPYDVAKLQVLLGLTYEKLGMNELARSMFETASQQPLHGMDSVVQHFAQHKTGSGAHGRLGLGEKETLNLQLGIKNAPKPEW